MTFAVLPFQAPANDPIAEGLARASGEAVQALQEARFHWARVSPAALVGKAVATQTAVRQIGSALHVHFLLRGTVVPVATGYTVDLAVIDAGTERVLDHRTLKAEPASPPRVKGSEIDDALAALTFSALKVEVAGAREQPDGLLDVRDLTFRAYVDWATAKGDPAAHAKATASLDRALAIAPDDLLALYVTAQINLCECLRSWAKNLGELEQVGVSAMDKYLRIRPNAPRMLELRTFVFLKHERYEEALLVADEVLRLDPDSELALSVRVRALLRLGRLPEALSASQAYLVVGDGADPNAMAAAVSFATHDDASASRLARKATSQLARDEAADPLAGAALLTLAAAEARAGHTDRAKAALKDFYAAVPGVRTIEEIKGWLLPPSPVPDDAAFFDALHLAGAAN